MTQLLSDKFNVAWFKLAEFVNRKEKERALALYRLLGHALLDKALITQLEADLLLAFKDEKAIEIYKRAAMLYETSGRLLDAALVYEHLASVIPAQEEVFEKMLQIYTLLSYESKMASCSAQLIRLLLNRQEQAKAYEILANSFFSSRHKALLHEAFVFGILHNVGSVYASSVHQHINGVIEGFLDNPEHWRLTRFLAHLAVVDAQVHEYACNLLKQ